MDSVYKTVLPCKWVSDSICVKDFLKSVADIEVQLNKLVSMNLTFIINEDVKGVNQSKIHTVRCQDLRMKSKIPLEQKIQMTLKVDLSMLESLQKDCGANKLDGLGEPQIEMLTLQSRKPLLERLPKNSNLYSLRKQAEDVKLRMFNLPLRQSLKTYWRRYTRIDYPIIGNSPTAPILPKKKQKLLKEEVILIVQIFKPVHHNEKPSHKTKLTIHNLEQELAVLGCQRLTNLRDKIYCISDEAIPFDLSTDPNKKIVSSKGKDIYKSGFFYINGTFYNDLRDPVSIDYSEVIRKWAEDSKQEMGPFKFCSMSDISFLELEIKLGYPYVYQHQGDCEHVLVFSDLRSLHPDDYHFKDQYPLPVRFMPKRRVICMNCNRRTVVWITYSHKRCWDSPFLFCDFCFQNFNYTIDNEKINDFKAYLISDISV